MKKVAITTLGCKTNQFESAAMVESVRKQGFLMVPFSEAADIYIINTCTVTAKTDSESCRLIRRARRQNATARIVVTGCYAQIAFEKISHLPGVSLVLGNSEKKGITGFLEEIDETQKIVVSDISQEKHAEGFKLETFAEHTRAFLQVQNGCNAFCSYCIVPYVRGRSRSVAPESVLDGVETFAEKGFKEVVLTGIHLGAYGLDLDPPKSLLELIAAIEERKLVSRLRIGSLEPTDIHDTFIKFLSGSKMVCPHFHIPLQSGDDQVLWKMNRHYTSDFYCSVIERLLASIPEACIGTDVIAGFPGESEREFENTCHFLESLPLSYFHVFPFSPREKTPAAKMNGQVKDGVVKERAKVLRRLSDLKKRSYFNNFLGKELEVLVQNREESGSLKGLARNYVPVILDGADSLINTEVRVRITEVSLDHVRGVVVD
jgi:threonylcarbamoyladenosine tRNA methylthiotransferase MtaB